MPPFEQSDPLEALKGVTRAALQAVSSQTVANEPNPLNRRVLESYVQQMFEAVLHPDQNTLRTVVRSMQKAMVPRVQIAEIYVPIVARRLGDAWVADVLAFGAVTIGAARLQGLLHQLSADWHMPSIAGTENRARYLVGVPDGVHHTLGACVLAGQLRHRGLGVHLEVALTAPILASLQKDETFAALFLSASTKGDLESLGKLVETSHLLSRGTPVIIGGTILEQVDDILSVIPADLASSDLQEALAFCDARASVTDNRERG